MSGISREMTCLGLTAPGEPGRLTSDEAYARATGKGTEWPLINGQQDDKGLGARPASMNSATHEGLG